MFKDQLRLLRKQHHLTQAQLAAKLGVSTSAIGMYEQGRREPDNAFLRRLSVLFHVSTDYLLGISSETEISEVIDSFTRLLESEQNLLFHGRPLEKQEREKIVNAIRIAMAVAVPEENREKNGEKTSQ